MLDALFFQLDTIDDFLWGTFGIPIIVILGLYFTLASRFLQIRGFLPSLSLFSNFLRKRGKKSKTGIHPLQAFFASVGGCVGIGNIVGICIGVQLGGPGALFWVWVTATVGMVLKYVEVYLGMRYRIANSRGGYDGGPMYYLQQAFSSRWIPVSVCVLLGIYGVEVFQFSAVAQSLSSNLSLNYYAVVFGLLALVIYAGLGGVRRVGKIASTIIPLFALVYLAMGMWVLWMNIGAIPGVIYDIVYYAFQPHAAVGGFVGSSIVYTISQGVRRGCYTADIGIGYASVIHTETQETVPERQALLTFVGVFIDTFLICTNSILLILVTGVWQQPIDASLLVQTALEQYFPYMYLFMPLFLFLLGYSTINAYFVVGVKCAEFLSPRYGKKAYFVYAVLALFLFSFGGTEQALTVMSITAALLLMINAVGFIRLQRQVAYPRDAARQIITTELSENTESAVSK